MPEPKHTPVDWDKVEYLFAGAIIGYLLHMIQEYVLYEWFFR